MGNPAETDPAGAVYFYFGYDGGGCGEAEGGLGMRMDGVIVTVVVDVRGMFGGEKVEGIGFYYKEM